VQFITTEESVFIRLCLVVTGTEYLDNPEDIGTLALVLYWLVATLFVGLVLFLCYLVLHRYRAKKISSK